MSRGRLVVHGHFYQPSRADPFTGVVPADGSAAPAHDWTARVSAECYRPNAELGNLSRMSWDVGPTLASWLEDGDTVAYRGFVEGDLGHNGLAQPYHHTILPLASAADRRTEIAWGLRDFAYRFGRPATGVWLPEAAVDLPTLRLLASMGIRHTILAPWQIADRHADTRRPHRVELGDGRDIVVAAYDGGLSAAVSFEPRATADADAFAAERIAPLLASGTLPDDEPPIVVICTDGELYGHHQQFRDRFLERLLAAGAGGPDRAFDVMSLAEALAEPVPGTFRTGEIVERTSWSCHHGVARWAGDCGCVPDGRWKGPLRAALDRLAAGIDAATDQAARGWDGVDPWAARDAYVDVVIGAETAEAFAARRFRASSRASATGSFANVMEAQRWRLAMFASDGWFWDDPTRAETASILRAAARAARLVATEVDGASALERRFIDDLRLLTSPGHGIDGGEIYRRALEEVGQPAFGG
ncbi:MAG: DUF3536 domain-containing protein [Chloroflexota bacterium]